MGNISVTTKVPGTCGEFIQGVLNGEDILVTSPVNLFSYVSVSFTTTPKPPHQNFLRGEKSLVWGCKNKKNELLENKWKSKEALKKVLEFFNTPELQNKLQVDIYSEIPVGKGMASSTADIVGVCLATAKLLGKTISDKTIADIAASIEPSDGTMFSGIVVFDPLKGKMIENLGKAPGMKVFIIDTGGEIDTIEFSKTDHKKIRQSNEGKIKKAFKMLKEGLRRNDLAMVGKAATISGICNQKILFKPELERIIEISQEFAAYGVNVAHSGTVIGILLSESFNRFNILKEKVCKAFNKEFEFYETALTDGGGVLVRCTE